MVYETIVNEGFTLHLRPTDVVSMVQSFFAYFAIFANNVNITLRSKLGDIDSAKAYIDQDKVIFEVVVCYQYSNFVHARCFMY